MTRFLFLLLFLFSGLGLGSQSVQGWVTDENGEPLSFASVYVEGTSKGTSTNLEGYFSLNLEKGNHVLVIRYVGYTTFREPIQVMDIPLEIHISLGPTALEIEEVLVRASGEDPAYGIIRNAIERRSYYLNHIEKQKSNAYIKGTYYMTKAPEFIMGLSMEDIDDFAVRDSGEHPIVYLAETESDYYKMNPNHKREVVKSTRVSGNSQGFAFNSALLMDVNLYQNNVDLMSSLKSPISRAAFSYYDYRLEGTSVAEDGNLIYKIRLLPKDQRGPVFSGLIYIRDSSWNISEANLWITGNNIQNELLDTLYLRQIHIPLQQEKWVLFQQSLDVKVSVMGFEIEGGFTAVFSEYDLNPELDERFFKREIIGFDSDFNKRSTSYWDSIRPIPLIEQESWDYHYKDSLEERRNDPARIDSLDREYNRFKLQDILFGYNYRNRNRNISGQIYSPLADFNFNTVQGFHLNLRSEVELKDFFREEDALIMEGLLNYGFSESQLRGQGRISYLFNKISRSKLTISGGTKVAHFNEKQPIYEWINTFYSLFSGKNYAKYFQKKYALVEFSSRPLRWLGGEVSFEYAERKTLENHTNYSFRSEPEYTPNMPIGAEEGGFATHSVFKADLRFNFFPGVKYVNFPNQRVYTSGSVWPQMSVGVSMGWIYEGEGSSFAKVEAGLTYSRKLGVWGSSGLRMDGGVTVAGENQMEFIDYKHFWGNETFTGVSSDYPWSYFTLPYYEYSTAGSHLQVHYQHNFEGEIMRRIPLLRILQSHLLMGYKGLLTEDQKPWHEAHIGLGNLGFGVLRILRFDVVFTHQGQDFLGSHFRMGVNLPMKRHWFR